MTAASDIIIRNMACSDIEEVYEIERDSFSEPWHKDSFEYSINAEHDYSVVAVCDGRICGYLMLRISCDCADIMNVAVDASYRKKGIASILMKNVMEYGRSKGVETFILEVRESNAPAIALYEKMGFNVIGKRKAYYTSPVEDALVMMQP